jgi:hypothetical protein
MPNRLAGSLQGSCQTRPRAGLSPDIALAPAKRRCSDLCLEKKRPLGQRVLDGLSGVRAVGRLKTVVEDSETVSLEIRTLNAAMIP